MIRYFLMATREQRSYVVVNFYTFRVTFYGWNLVDKPVIDSQSFGTGMTWQLEGLIQKGHYVELTREPDLSAWGAL